MTLNYQWTREGSELLLELIFCFLKVDTFLKILATSTQLMVFGESIKRKDSQSSFQDAQQLRQELFS